MAAWDVKKRGKDNGHGCKRKMFSLMREPIRPTQPCICTGLRKLHTGASVSARCLHKTLKHLLNIDCVTSLGIEFKTILTIIRFHKMFGLHLAYVKLIF